MHVPHNERMVPGEAIQEAQQRPSLSERLKRYLVYAILFVSAAILLYIFVWFGTQLGLQN